MLNIHSIPLPFKLGREECISVSQWLFKKQLAFLLHMVPQLISRLFICCMYKSVLKRPSSKSHTYVKRLCTSVSMYLYHGRGPDGSLDTEDELASVQVSMAAASSIRLSLQPPLAHTLSCIHKNTPHCILPGLPHTTVLIFCSS